MVWPIIAAGVIGAAGSAYAGRQGAKAAERAAGTSAEIQQQGLDYLRESERLPMYYRDQALADLAAEYGLMPFQESPQAAMATEREINPAYAELQSELSAARRPAARFAIQRDLEQTPQYLDTPCLKPI